MKSIVIFLAIIIMASFVFLTSCQTSCTALCRFGSCQCDGSTSSSRCGCSFGFPHCKCGNAITTSLQRDNINRLIEHLKPDTSTSSHELLDNVIRYQHLMTDGKEKNVSELVSDISASVEKLDATQRASYENFISTLKEEDK